MMEATDQGQFNHLATLWRFYPPRHETIMLEGSMGGVRGDINPDSFAEAAVAAVDGRR